VIVADASAVVGLLLGGESAVDVGRRLLDPAETIHVPHLLDVEVAQALRRYALSGELDAERGMLALAYLSQLPLRRHRHYDLIPRVWELRSSITAYDAVYIALAEVLRAPLVTRDSRLARAHGHTARIELI
jgi:predicted nucleic acid-binding protein